MTLPKLVNLLDDFSLGGVSRGLGIFDSAPIRAVVSPAVVGIDSNALIAPRLDADIIVTHFTPNWRRVAFLASLRARNPRATIIHVEHSYTKAWQLAKIGNHRRFQTMLALSARLVNKIVCVSSAQADWFAKASGQARSAIEVIYPYSENPGLAQLELPDFTGTKPLRVGAYGRFHEAKGFDLLIGAWKSGCLPGTELVIGGFGPEEENLQALAGGATGIRFAGKISNVAAFLETCDIVAVPSRWEAFGQVATEAREAGRPIFVSPIDGLPEQVGRAGRIVDFTSNEAIADAFASTSRLNLAEMSRNARFAVQGAGASRQRDWAHLLSGLVEKRSELAKPNGLADLATGN